MTWFKIEAEQEKKMIGIHESINKYKYIQRVFDHGTHQNDSLALKKWIAATRKQQQSQPQQNTTKLIDLKKMQ